MQIVPIEPDKKYVLVFSEMNGEKVRDICEKLAKFLADDQKGLIAIYGDNIVVVSADQVLGYQMFDPSVEP